MEPGDLLDHGSGDDSIIVVMKGNGQPLNLLLLLVLEIISVYGINLVFLQTHFILSPGHVLQPENIKYKTAAIQECVMCASMEAVSIHTKLRQSMKDQIAAKWVRVCPAVGSRQSTQISSSSRSCNGAHSGHGHTSRAGHMKQTVDTLTNFIWTEQDLKCDI